MSHERLPHETTFAQNGQGSRQPLFELTTRLPGQKPPPNIDGDHKVLIIHKNGGSKRTTFAMFPVVDRPLTPAIKTKRGPAGEGRSKKSSAEARRKFKEAKKSSRK